MKVEFKRWAAVAVLLLLGVRVQAQEYVQLASNYDYAEAPAAAPISEEYANSTGCAECEGCQAGGSNCQYCNGVGTCNHCGRGTSWCPAIADHCPRFGIDLFSGFENWRGVSEAGGPSNFGYFSGLNIGGPIPVLQELGIGAQAGLSQGYYDFMGRSTNGADEANRWQQQTMLTYGLFRRADEGKPLSWSVVQDWSVNENFGTTSNEPTLSQWRAQIGLATSGRNEFGAWAAWRDRGATQNGVSFRAINQTNFYWHRKWLYGGSDSWVWLGFPSYGRLNQAAGAGGSIGEIIAGGHFNVPVNDRMSVFANVQYMKPSARGGVFASTEDFYNLSIGMSFFPGMTARSRTVAGRSWMPVTRVANNGSFMIDRNM